MRLPGRLMLESAGRFTDDIAEAAPADLALVSELAVAFKHRTYHFPDGVVALTIDWSSFVATNPSTSRQPVDLSLTLETSISDITPALIAEVFAAELYLMCNLSSPGFFSGFEATIVFLGTEKRRTIMDGYLFDRAWADASAGTPPAVGALPLRTVVEWYDTLNIGPKQLATTPIEKVLFSLLHAGRTSALEPAATLWLAQAIEAIYQVPPALSQNFIAERAATLLGFTSRELSPFKKRLRAFYDARNTFAHGGAEIMHPMANDGWEATLTDLYDIWVNAGAFGTQLILATLQELIRRRWRGLEFRHELHGEPVAGG